MIHRPSQLCSLLIVGVVINIWRHSPISFKHVSLRCLLFRPQQTTYQSSTWAGLRKQATQDPPTLLMALIIICVFDYYDSYYPFGVQIGTNAQTHLRWPSYGKNVGLIHLVFHVLHHKPIGFTQPNLCCIGISTTKCEPSSDGKLDLLWFTYGFPKCMFVYFLTEYIRPSNCVSLLSLEYVAECEDIFQSVSTHVFLWCSFLDPCQYHTPLKYKKRNQITPVHLTLLSSKRIMATLILLAQIELHVIMVYIASTFVTAANYNSNYVGRDNFLLLPMQFWNRVLLLHPEDEFVLSSNLSLTPKCEMNYCSVWQV